MEFIVGKWYKNPGNFKGAKTTWAKFKERKDNNFYFSERIYKGSYENKSSHWFYSSSEKSYAPINIEEIRQYLPLYHPDCVTITNENMKYLISILKKHGIK